MIDELCRMCQQTRVMLKKVWKGFLTHEKLPLQEADKIGQEIDAMCLDLTSRLAESEDKILTPLPGEFERIGDSFQSILHTVISKITNDIMFSERAVKEVGSLFEGVDELLECLSDVIKTKNRVLINHITERSAELSQLSMDYTCAHSDRLIGGLCFPKSAPIYLDMLDSLRNIAIHIRTIAERINQETKVSN